MSADNQRNSNPLNSDNNPNDMSRNRRGSITSAAFTSLFQRSNSTSTATPVISGLNDQRRRLSVSTVGLSGTSPTGMNIPFGLRRGSLSTNGSDSIDENVVDEDDGSSSTRTAPTTPFSRRLSFGAQAAMRGMRPGGTSPGTNDQGFNWSEQLKSRAETTIATGSRSQFPFNSGLSSSPPRGIAVGGRPSTPHHDRAKSVSDMPAPPVQARPRERPKPDAFQERILKGDFYMD